MKGQVGIPPAGSPPAHGEHANRARGRGVPVRVGSAPGAAGVGAEQGEAGGTAGRRPAPMRVSELDPFRCPPGLLCTAPVVPGAEPTTRVRGPLASHGRCGRLGLWSPASRRCRRPRLATMGSFSISREDQPSDAPVCGPRSGPAVIGAARLGWGASDALVLSLPRMVACFTMPPTDVRASAHPPDLRGGR
jgi:hypothetical protein